MEEELLQRQLPHSLEAEQSVLGSMLIDSRCVAEVIGILRPDDFFLPQNKDIYETIYTMFSYSKAIDGVTVAEEMQKNGTYDPETTRSYLVQLMEVTPTSANVMEYAAIVRDKALLRGLAKAAGDILGMVQEGIGEAQATLEAADGVDLLLRRLQDIVGLAHAVVHQGRDLRQGGVGMRVGVFVVMVEGMRVVMFMVVLVWMPVVVGMGVAVFAGRRGGLLHRAVDGDGDVGAGHAAVFPLRRRHVYAGQAQAVEAAEKGRRVRQQL